MTTRVNGRGARGLARLVLALLIGCAALACSGRPSAIAATPRPVGSGSAGATALETVVGTASYYSDRLHNRRTASGVPYDRNAWVAAHRSYPFGTVLRVTNLENGRTVTVQVVDRGPFVRGRILDLSRRAAEELGFIRQGLARVRVEVLEWGTGRVVR
jgi:rare lipoprotein A